VGDITYVATQEGWLFLAVVIDLFSRQVVGWSMNKRMKALLVNDALLMLYGKENQRKGWYGIQTEEANMHQIVIEIY